MLVEYGRQLGVRGDDGGAEAADRALLPEQRRGVQAAPTAGRPHPRPDLEVDMPVRVASAGGVMHDRDGFELFDRHHLLLPARADPGDAVLPEPAPDLGHRIRLRRIQGLRYLRVQRGRNRQGLRSVHDHLREPRGTLLGLASEPGFSHRLPVERVDPVHPRGVLLRGQPDLADHLPGGVHGRELRDRGPGLQVVVVGQGTVGLQIAAGLRTRAPEQDHTALHRRLLLTHVLATTYGSIRALVLGRESSVRLRRRSGTVERDGRSRRVEREKRNGMVRAR